MRRLLYTVILALISGGIYCQAQIRISPPELSFQNGILTIRYDIAGCATGELVDIKLIILNSRGDTLKPSYVSGDLGSRVSCGFGKKIDWNMVRDGVLIDEEIEVQLTGIPVIPDVPPVTYITEKNLSRANVFLSSLFVPGLGQKKASGKSTHLLMTGICYGSLGGASFFLLKSKNYYDDYQAATGTLRDELFEKSEKAFKNGQYFIYGAAGAWAVNLIMAATIPIKDESDKKVSVNLLTTPGSGVLLAAKWTF